MSEHRWSYCPHCMVVMVHCGYCDNNTCNGGTGDNCPDNCASAHAFESANTPPAELRARQDKENAEWAAMTPDERDMRNQKLFDGMLP